MPLKTSADFHALLSNPNLEHGIMEPILDTDDNTTPDTLVTSTSSFKVAERELHAAGYLPYTSNLLNWHNGDSRATIEIVPTTGAYGIVFYPSAEAKAKTAQAEAAALYTRLINHDATLQDHAAWLTKLNYATHDQAEEIGCAHGDIKAQAQKLRHLSAQFSIWAPLMLHYERNKFYTQLTLALLSVTSLINLAAIIIR